MDIHFAACFLPRCTELTFISPLVSDLGALKGSSFHHLLPASVHWPDLHFVTCFRPRCTKRTFISPLASGLGALNGPSFHHLLPASVHWTDLHFTTCFRPRCTERTFISPLASGLGALNGYSFRHFLPASVHRTNLHFDTCFRPRCTERTFYFVTCFRLRCTARTFISPLASHFGALNGPLIRHLLPASVHWKFINNFKGTKIWKPFVQDSIVTDIEGSNRPEFSNTKETIFVPVSPWHSALTFHTSRATGQDINQQKSLLFCLPIYGLL